MARKTTGTTPTRSKRTTPTTETAAVQPAPPQVVPEVRSNVTPIKLVAKKTTPVDLDEEIRCRAYELFLERKGTAGDPALDWFNAEREVRARYAGQNPSALAAGQGRT